MSTAPTTPTSDPWPESRERLEATFEGAAMLDQEEGASRMTTIPISEPDEPVIDCPICNGSGFSGYGSGYDAVCGECGGQRQILARLCSEVESTK